MSGENRIGIDFVAGGQQQVIAAAQQTSAAINQANQSTAVAAKASGDTQIQTNSYVENSFRQLASAAIGYLGVMQLSREAYKDFQMVAERDTAINRVTVTMSQLGLSTGGVKQAMMALEDEFIRWGQTGDAAYGTFQNLVQATGNVQRATELETEALKFAVRWHENVESVVTAVTKAYEGQPMLLNRLLESHGLAAKGAKDFYESEALLKKGGEGANQVLSDQQKLLFAGKAQWHEFSEAVGAAYFWYVKMVEKVNWLGHLLWDKHDMKGTTGGAVFVAAPEAGKLDVTNVNPPSPYGTGGAAGAVADTGASFDLKEYAAMVKAQEDFAQVAAGNEIEIAAHKRERMVQITGSEVSMQTAIYQRGFLAYKAMTDDALNHHKAFQAAVGNFTANSIDGMVNLWGGYFKAIATGEQVKTNMFAASGELMLAMLLDQVRQALQAEAVKHATLGAAYLAGAIFNPLLLLPALGEFAVAGALGIGAVAAGAGASALTPAGAQVAVPVTVTNPGGGSGGGGNYGGYGSAPQGGQTISNSNVTIYYNPTMVVSGNVYGMDDFRKLVMGFFQQYAYIRGMDLNGATGG
jgi:hypothetical protein